MDNKIISTSVVTAETIKAHIYNIRGRMVMIDRDLSDLYGMETKSLKRSVRMNIERFPADFMFELTKEEYDSLRCKNCTLKSGRGQHSKYLPYAFTQEGVAMLSSVLRTPLAIQVNINIMRAFFQMKQAILAVSNAQLQIEQIRSEIRQLRIDMDETLRVQNDINEMLSKEQDDMFVQIENINDAIAQLQAETVLKKLGDQEKPIGEVFHSDLERQRELIERALTLAGNELSDVDNISRLGEGWVGEETLAIAIYAVARHIDSFEDTLVAAVNHDGDSDSTGAVAGNIIGAIVGYDVIPDKFKKNLEPHDVILAIADDLHQGCIISEDEEMDTPEKQEWYQRYCKMQPAGFEK